MSKLTKALGMDNKVSTSTASVDPATVAQQQKLYGYANAQAKIGGAPVDPNTYGALDQYKQAAGVTNLGLSAMTGNPAAMSQFMNPYQSQVMDAMNAQFDHQNAATANDVNSMATANGAFGGSRAAVAQGVARANNVMNQNALRAQLLNSGYSNAINQANNVANFGLGANGQVASLADYLRNIQLQNQGYATDTTRQNIMPTGQTNTQITPGISALQAGLGAYTAGASLFGGGGAPSPSAGANTPSFTPMQTPFLSSPQSMSLFGSY